VVAEGAALSGSWRSRFRSRPCMGTSGMNPSCHGRPCGHRCHTDRNPCIPRRRLPASTGPSATACRQTAGHQGRNGRTRRHPVGSSLLRRPTAAHGAARAARGAPVSRSLRRTEFCAMECVSRPRSGPRQTVRRRGLRKLRPQAPFSLQPPRARRGGGAA